ncbi:MAG: sigma 54-interacting transcriptional regulator [Deltaproteobacteria bacterium]|nr:sigma 54-interacting transcriptional regulator [Deltaproteobacteria bacterium]
MKRVADLQRNTLFKILESSYDEIFVTDAGGVVIYVNPICERHYGLKSADVLGRRAESLVDEGYYSPPIIHRVMRERRQVNIVQKTNIGKTLLVTATPVFSENGKLEMVVQNARDITQLEIIKQELEKANRLVSEFRDEINPKLNSDVGTFGLIGQSPRFKELIAYASQIAPIDASVILLGESGTGKGVLARYIHEVSHRSQHPFVSINCAAIPNELIETELFGYAGGAFTGAHPKGRIGRIELAGGGTLLLDEIAELPLHLQAKLLEVVQERQLTPVGGNRTKSLDIRIICATNRDLHAMVANQTFRSDLYHRLKVIEIEIPPLKERSQDILPLANYYLGQFDKQFGKIHTLSSETADALLAYHWPGNIRELMHTTELVAATVDNGEVKPGNLPPAFSRQTVTTFQLDGAPQGLDAALESLTRKLVVEAYHMLKSSYKVAAYLNISQSKAHRLIRKYVGASRKESRINRKGSTLYRLD